VEGRGEAQPPHTPPWVMQDKCSHVSRERGQLARGHATGATPSPRRAGSPRCEQVQRRGKHPHGNATHGGRTSPRSSMGNAGMNLVSGVSGHAGLQQRARDGVEHSGRPVAGRQPDAANERASVDMQRGGGERTEAPVGVAVGDRFREKVDDHRSLAMFVYSLTKSS